MSWLDKYVEFAKNNEALPLYHWWAGLTILGAALQRRVSFSRGYYCVYPAIWTLIIGPSGSKKTTAVTVSYNILSKLDHIKLLADRLTPEALARSLAERNEDGVRAAQGILYAPELSSFLDKKRHNEGMVPLLLRLADCPDRWVYETIGGGKIPLKDVAVTFLGATANDLLYECVPALALKSGFLARFICVAGKDSAGVVAHPWSDPHLERELINELYEISLLKGRMALPKEARNWYTDWYYAHKAQSVTEGSVKLRAYYERKPDHLLRVAMLLSISKYRRLEYTVETLEEGLEHLNETEEALPELYGELEATDSGREQMLILDQLRRAGGALTHTQLFKLNHTKFSDPATFKKLVASLIEAGKVIVERRGRDIVYRRKK